MSKFVNDLNPIQQNAVTHTQGPVLVVAGPGSGKTRVLTYRIAHIIESGVKPWEILALTFTNKAANEMKDRIQKVVGDSAYAVWAGTFHSIFARILRIEASKMGYTSNFTIYDSEDTKGVLNGIIKEMNLDKTAYNVNSIRSRISSAKSNLIPPKLYAQNEELIEQDKQAKRPFLYEIYARYMMKCKRSDAMDFDDLLYQFYALLYKNIDNVREKYQKKFKYILVDEFQDTNYLQYELLKLLVLFEGSEKNITVVGDDAQSIYAFRGATIDNILNFEKEFPDVSIIKLEQNYRSTEHIVQAANEVILHNKRQIQKKIWSNKGVGNKINVQRYVSDTEEGKRVADLILEQKNRNHLRNSEIAILYRTNSQSRIFEEYLRRYNVPYRIYGGLSFYQRKEIKDLMAYLRLVVNPKDEEALKRIINYPRRGIGDTTVDKISKEANLQGLSLWDCLLSVEVGQQAKKAIQDFVKMINVFREKANIVNAYEITRYVLQQSKLWDELKSDHTPEGLSRIENIEALLNGVNNFVDNDEESEELETTTDKSLSSYLQTIALVTDLEDVDNTSEDKKDVVTLMSVHAAKGLEFKSVFVVGLEEQLFPSFMSMESPEELDEERRLFYVAITRAELFLTLTYASSRYKFGNLKQSPPSRFLQEIAANHLEGSAVRGLQHERDYEPTAKLSGNFKVFTPAGRRAEKNNFEAPANFKPAEADKIMKGMKVMHIKFGEGEVLDIDGARDNRVATIFFSNLNEEPKKRIMLKFSKLQILN